MEYIVASEKLPTTQTRRGNELRGEIKSIIKKIPPRPNISKEEHQHTAVEEEQHQNDPPADLVVMARRIT